MRVKFFEAGFLAALFIMALAMHPLRGEAQEHDAPISRPTTAEASAPDMSAVTDLIRALQTQVQALTSQVKDLGDNQQRMSIESASLRNELETTRAALALRDGEVASPAAAASAEVATLKPIQSVGMEQRVSKIEDAQQITEARLAEQNQIKVESGSKYRLRLSGMVLVNLFHTQGNVDNLDFAQLATPRDPLESTRALGGSLRQSQIELSAFGPDFAGAHTSANLKFDFAGGFANSPNGITMGLVRLRTGTIRLDWTNTSLVAGQDGLFFAPLIPTSLSSVAIPPLAYAGRLWNWAPQVRIEHQIALSDSTSVLVQGGILDSLTGDLPVLVPRPGSYRDPTAGEQSGQPAYASRIAVRHRAFGKEFTLGAGGYYARENWGFGRSVDSWAATTDLLLPITSWMTFSGEFYRGRAVAGLGGAIGQNILLSEPAGNLYDSATRVRGLDSMGGWMQLKFKPKTNFEVNAAVGQDNPFSWELRRFPATAQYYGPLQSKNFSPFLNFIYQLRSDMLFSVEYRRLQSYPLDSAPNKVNQISLSMGYLF
jgi:regulator of replication initiation timing